VSSLKSLYLSQQKTPCVILKLMFNGIKSSGSILSLEYSQKWEKGNLDRLSGSSFELSSCIKSIDSLRFHFGGV